MGGYGSGRRYSLARKRTVEECICLKISSFKKMLFDGANGYGTFTTFLGNMQVGFSVEITEDVQQMELSHWLADEIEQFQTFGLSNTIHGKAVRWWFLCPTLHCEI